MSILPPFEGPDAVGSTLRARSGSTIRRASVWTQASITPGEPTST